MASDQEMGKKMIEEDDLFYFLDAYRMATGEALVEITRSETPDFLCVDSCGQTVGIELTKLKFPPDYMFWKRAIEKEEWASHEDAFWRIIGLMANKTEKLGKGNWPTCERKILVIQMVDYPLSELLPNAETDQPDGTDFSEVWLADYSILDMYGDVDLFPIVHPTLEGYFPVASKDQKPWG